MKKALVFFMVLVFTFSMSLSAFAASDKGNNGKGNSASDKGNNGKGKGANKADIQTGTELSDKALLKQFKMEMNQKLKRMDTLQSDRDALQAQLTALQSDTTVLDPATEAAQIAANNQLITDLQTKIGEIDKMLADPEAAKKQLINERFMVIKSVKSGFTLSEFENAEALIAAMYTASQDPSAWSLWVNKSENLLKLEGPLYLKGSKIMFPLRAMTDLGATVTWSEEDKTVTVVGANGITVVFAPDGKTAATQTSVESAAIAFADGALPGEKIGTITATLTDPVTGVIYDVEASITFTLPVDTNGVISDETLTATTVTADILDPDTGDVIKTVDLDLSGTLTDPVLSFEEASLDVDLSGETVINCGRAYHPLNDLAEIFALDIAADTATGTVEVAPEETIPEA